MNPLHIFCNTAARSQAQNLFHCVEKESEETLTRLWTTNPECEDMMTGLGSAGTKNKTQTAEARRVVENYIMNIPEDAMIFFTDSSALGNPGPCGAVAVCYIQGLKSQLVTLVEAVAPLSTSYHGELMAIFLAIRFMIDSSAYKHCQKAYILSDCQSAISSVCSQDIHKSHQRLIDNIKSDIQTLLERGLRITLNWIAGHVSLQGNEQADHAAKIAAESAKDIPFREDTISLSTLKGILKRQSKKRWQNMWRLSDNARRLYEWCPDVSKDKFPRIQKRGIETKAVRLVTGQTRLNKKMFDY